MQRAGRAGREVYCYPRFHHVMIDLYQGPGFCFRLYTEEAFNKLAVSAEPEIHRCSLTQSVLHLKCLGQDIEEVEFMDRPEINSGTC